VRAIRVKASIRMKILSKMLVCMRDRRRLMPLIPGSRSRSWPCSNGPYLHPHPSLRLRTSSNTCHLHKHKPAKPCLEAHLPTSHTICTTPHSHHTKISLAAVAMVLATNTQGRPSTQLATSRRLCFPLFSKAHLGGGIT